MAECDGLLNRWARYSLSRGFESRPLRLEVTDDDGQCQEATEALQTQGDSQPGSGRCHAPTHTDPATGDDRADTGNVRSDDKESDKVVSGDPDLQTVADAWDDLPGAVKAGMLAMVRAQR